MEKALLLICALAFTVIVLFILGVYSYIGHRRDRQDIMKRVKQPEERIETGGEAHLFDAAKKYLLNMVGNLGDRAKPKGEGELSHLRKRFLKAGYRGVNTAAIFFGAKTFLAILLGVGFILVKLAFLKTMTPLPLIFLAVSLALIGFYLPDLWLRIRIARRKEEIWKGFPDALDLLVVCVEAGIGLDAAVNRVGEEMRLSNKTLSQEFRMLSLELRAGKSRRDALRNLAIRTDLEDVSNFVTLLVQTDKFGGSVAKAVRVQSDSMRAKRHQFAEELAAKLPVKLVFPLILFIFPALFVAILGPAVIRIYRVLLPTLGQ